MSGVLFVHTNFPAQFADIARALVARGERCAAIGSADAPGLYGVRVERWNNTRGSTPDLFPLAVRAEADLIRGHAAWMAARTLKAEGFEPDLIIGHPGWGETVFMGDLWPKARQILFGEYFYQGRGGDIDFDNEFFQPGMQAILAGKAKNAVMALTYTDADAIVCPTEYQASTLPAVFRPRIHVIHEGVDVDAIRPGPSIPITLEDQRVLGPEVPIITHVNRHLEPMRGLHILLRALPRLQAAVPEAHVVIVGNPSERGYAGAAPDGKTWKDAILATVEGELDLSRVHFPGRLRHENMVMALQRSRAHVYYTYPFVLSWSVIEAMSAGCYVIASDTPPVRDAIVDGVNGKLLPFFNHNLLADALIEACEAPPDARRPSPGSAARTAAPSGCS
jgi:glycosyltransferase involved in cell wall biosynthesis